MASDYVKGLVSLLLICHNHEKFIGDAIESVLAQTYDNIEIIICDDFSTDHSWEIIQSFVPELQKRFHRVVVYQNPQNLGLILSMNKMVKEVRGAVTFWLSGDDMMAKNYVSDIMDACLEHPDASVFVTDGYWVDEADRYSELDISLLTPFYQQKPDLSKETLFQRLFWQNCIFAPGVSLRSEIYDKFGFYDPDICIEDLEYWLRISVTGETEFVYIDKRDVFYRKNANSATSKEKNEHYVERWLIFFEASEKIIEKYAPYVEVNEYIRRKFQFLLDEWQFYKRNIPKDECKILRSKLGPFVKMNWRALGWKQLIEYYRMYANALLNRAGRIFIDKEQDRQLTDCED